MNGSDINIIQNRMNNNQETLGKQFEFSNLENINSEFIISEYQAKLMSQAANLYDPQFYNRNRFNKFARYGMLDITNNHQGSREYLFFSKPDLHIFDVNNDNYSLYNPLSELEFFKNSASQYPESLLSLQQTYYNINNKTYPNSHNLRNKFMPILSNHVSSSLDLPGITATEIQNNTNLYQVTTSYREGSEVSDIKYEFSLEFNDTKYLDVYMLYKAYDEYMRETYKRIILPTKISYIDNMINYKQFSIWKIIVDHTNNIIFHGKVTGVHPLTVPRDAMSNFEGGIKLTVQFSGTFVRDMRPEKLLEINHLTELSMGVDRNYISNNLNSLMLPLYDADAGGANTEWGGYPYILKTGNNKHGIPTSGAAFQLVWLRGEER